LTYEVFIIKILLTLKIFEQLVTATIHGNQLMLSYEPNVNGMAILTVRGTSKGKFINDSFNVIVEPEDSPPEIVNALNDVT